MGASFFWYVLTFSERRKRRTRYGWDAYGWRGKGRSERTERCSSFVDGGIGWAMSCVSRVEAARVDHIDLCLDRVEDNGGEGDWIETSDRSVFEDMDEDDSAGRWTDCRRNLGNPANPRRHAQFSATLSVGQEHPTASPSCPNQIGRKNRSTGNHQSQTGDH